jgi:hypothetical protein
MADWNNETDSIVPECKLRTLSSKWNNAGEQRTARQPVQQPSELDWGECGSENWSTNHGDESIVEHSVATQEIET